MTRFEGFTETMNQLRGEAEIALLQIYPSPEQCAAIVARVIAKIKESCAEENNIAVFLACGHILVAVTKERILRETEEPNAGS